MWFTSLSHVVIFMWSWALYHVEQVDVIIQILCVLNLFLLPWCKSDSACIMVVLGLGYDCDLLWIMRIIIAMIVLKWSIPPFMV
jgi:hypothetical protein